MKRALSAALIALLLTGCSGAKPPVVPAPAPEVPAPEVPESPAPPAPPREPPPDLTARPPMTLGRDEVREGLLRLLEQPGEGGPAQRLQGMDYRKADLDGDGAREFILALPVHEAGDPNWHNGAALFVAYRKNGAWAVDRSDPMGRYDTVLMDPMLIAVTDLAGLGRPQIVWSRPEGINTGPQPVFAFVTAWQPGTFTHLPGKMAISRPGKGDVRISADGKDLVLTGISRREWFIRTDPDPVRTDRYRFVDGAFRLVDRRFDQPSDFGYDRLWDGLVAEEVGRLTNAEQAYRAAADARTVPHSGQVPRYKNFPRELPPEEMARFGEALRAFARFRLGALLFKQGRKPDLTATGPYAGLIQAALSAPDRPTACSAGAAWVAANPAFFADLMLGAGHSPWRPELLCTHMPLEERLLGEP